LQVFLELGFSQGVIQFASHEYARLALNADGRLTGDAASRARLLALARLVVRWYGVLAVLLVLLVGPVGHWFLARAGGGPAWELPWWLLISLAAANLFTQGVWFLLEGCNQVAYVNGYRVASQVAGHVVTWLAILGRLGLWAAGLAVAANVLVSVTLLARHWRGFLREIWHAPPTPVGPVLREVWPFQWRMALSACSGFLIFNLFSPAVFHFRGAEEAGRMGMTWQVVFSISVLAGAWVSTKAPQFGMLISRREFAALDTLFRRVATQAVLICAVVSLAAWTVVVLIQGRLALGERFLDPLSFGLLLLAATVNQVTFAQAYFLRAHKQEPFMVLSVLNGLVTAGGVVLATPALGALGTCLAYTAVQILIVPFATRVFLRKRADWRRTAASATTSAASSDAGGA
jgi:O-antigen/teichoic acid export membrane protein